MDRKRREEIRARLAEIRPGRWWAPADRVYAKAREGEPFVSDLDELDRQILVARFGSAPVWAGADSVAEHEQACCDANFVGMAPKDIADLLAWGERLEAELAALRRERGHP